MEATLHKAKDCISVKLCAWGDGNTAIRDDECVKKLYIAGLDGHVVAKWEDLIIKRGSGPPNGSSSPGQDL